MNMTTTEFDLYIDKNEYGRFCSLCQEQIIVSDQNSVRMKLKQEKNMGVLCFEDEVSQHSTLGPRTRSRHVDGVLEDGDGRR